MHDILILTEPWLVGMLKSQLNARYLNSPVPVVGGNAKITQMHDILILTEPVELVNAKITTNARYLNSHCTVLVGMLKSQLKCTIS
jgi:hypothetical protein